MFNSRSEQKVENKEQKSLDKFNAVWQEPIQDTIERFYKHDPSVFPQLHVVMKKATPKDIHIAKKTIYQLESQYRMFSNAEQLALLDILKSYIKALEENPSNLSQNLKESVLTKCHAIYNGEKLLKPPLRTLAKILIEQKDYSMCSTIPPLNHEQFYIAAHKSKVVDPWGIHILNGFPMFENHFDREERGFVRKQNPNALYLLGLQHELDQYCFSAQFGSAYEDKQDIENIIKLGSEKEDSDFSHFRKIPNNLDKDALIEELKIRRPDGLAALKCYRKALSCGFELALTGLARLYALGLGVEKDTEFAIKLYQMAMSLGVCGALPCDSGDLRILFYSTMVSGLSQNGTDNFEKFTSLQGMSYVETLWVMKMNSIDPTLAATLEKFKKFAIDNPNNLFDELFDELFDARGNVFDRLKLCLDEEAYQIVMERNKSFINNQIAASYTYFGV